MEKDKDESSTPESTADESPPFQPDPDLITQLERGADPDIVKTRVPDGGR